MGRLCAALEGGDHQHLRGVRLGSHGKKHGQKKKPALDRTACSAGAQARRCAPGPTAATPAWGVPTPRATHPERPPSPHSLQRRRRHPTASTNPEAPIPIRRRARPALPPPKNPKQVAGRAAPPTSPVTDGTRGCPAPHRRAHARARRPPRRMHAAAAAALGGACPHGRPTNPHGARPSRSHAPQKTPPATPAPQAEHPPKNRTEVRAQK